MSASLPTRPAWLSETAYTNILKDRATPRQHRLGVLKAMQNCADAVEGKKAFDEYFSKVNLNPSVQNLPGDSTLGHLYYAWGFFKRVTEVLGSGDENAVAESFATVRDEAVPRRERRKALKRLDRAMHGQPIRSDSPIWLYRDPAPISDPSAILIEVDACLPWKLALPRPEGDFIHFTFRGASIAGGCRTPNCKDPGFDHLSIWKHGGKTKPHNPCPNCCGTPSGLNEVVAPSVNYEQQLNPLGYCVSARLP